MPSPTRARDSSDDKDGGFRDYVESADGGGLKTRAPAIDTSSLKIDTSFDFSKLPGAAGERVEMTRVADAIKPRDGQGLKVDLDLGKVEEGVRKIKAKQKTDQIRAWVEEAQKLIAQQKYRDALKLLEKANQADPQSAQILVLKAYCLFGLGNHEGALDVLRQARGCPLDGETVVMIIILEAECQRAVTRAIETRLAELLKIKKTREALALVEQELQKVPGNLALIFHQANLLLLLKRAADARRVVMEVLPHLEGENLQMFAAVLAEIEMRESQLYIDAAKDCLRRGDPTGALEELGKAAVALSGHEQYRAIRSYADSLVPRSLLGGLFAKGRAAHLPDAALQGVLGWLLEPEISSGVESMKNGEYGKAIAAFEKADKIDARCQTVCFLHAVAIFKGFEQKIGAKQTPDLEDAIASFRKAALLLTACAGDSVVGEDARRFLEVVRSYQGQFETVQKERSRQAAEARPINELFEEFKTLMEGLKQNPISSTKELDRVERKLKDMKSRAERLQQKGSQDAREALGQLITALDNNLAQAAKLRSGAKSSGGGAPANNSVNAVVQLTMALQEQTKQKFLFSTQERQTYQTVVDYIRTGIANCRRETHDSQGRAALDACEQILNNIELRL